MVAEQLRSFEMVYKVQTLLDNNENVKQLQEDCVYVRWGLKTPAGDDLC